MATSTVSVDDGESFKSRSHSGSTLMSDAELGAILAGTSYYTPGSKKGDYRRGSFQSGDEPRLTSPPSDRSIRKSTSDQLLTDDELSKLLSSWGGGGSEAKGGGAVRSTSSLATSGKSDSQNTSSGGIIILLNGNQDSDDGHGDAGQSRRQGSHTLDVNGNYENLQQQRHQPMRISPSRYSRHSQDADSRTSDHDLDPNDLDLGSIVAASSRHEEIDLDSELPHEPHVSPGSLHHHHQQLDLDGRHLDVKVDHVPSIRERRGSTMISSLGPIREETSVREAVDTPSVTTSGGITLSSGDLESSPLTHLSLAPGTPGRDGDKKLDLGLQDTDVVTTSTSASVANVTDTKPGTVRVGNEDKDNSGDAKLATAAESKTSKADKKKKEVELREKTAETVETESPKRRSFFSFGKKKDKEKEGSKSKDDKDNKEEKQAKKELEREEKQQKKEREKAEKQAKKDREKEEKLQKKLEASAKVRPTSAPVETASIPAIIEIPPTPTKSIAPSLPSPSAKVETPNSSFYLPDVTENLERDVSDVRLRSDIDANTELKLVETEANPSDIEVKRELNLRGADASSELNISGASLEELKLNGPRLDAKRPDVKLSGPEIDTSLKHRINEPEVGLDKSSDFEREFNDSKVDLSGSFLESSAIEHQVHSQVKLEGSGLEASPKLELEAPEIETSLKHELHEPKVDVTSPKLSDVDLESSSRHEFNSPELHVSGAKVDADPEINLSGSSGFKSANPQLNLSGPKLDVDSVRNVGGSEVELRVPKFNTNPKIALSDLEHEVRSSPVSIDNISYRQVDGDFVEIVHSPTLTESVGRDGHLPHVNVDATTHLDEPKLPHAEINVEQPHHNESVLPHGKIDVEEPKLDRHKIDIEKPKVTRPKIDVEEPKVTRPKIDVEEPKVTRPKIDVEEPKVTRPKIDVEEPKVTRPKIDVEEPKVTRPKIDVEEPKVTRPKIDVEEPKLDRHKIDIEKPKVTRPKIDVEEPKVTRPKIDVEEPKVTRPKIDVGEPKVTRPKIDVEEPKVTRPKIDVEEPKVTRLKIDVEEPKVTRPKIDVEEPKVTRPKIDVEEPKVTQPKIDVEEPKVTRPKIDVEEPKVTRPKIDVEEPKVTRPKIDVEEPKVTRPKIDVAGSHYNESKLPRHEVDIEESSVEDIFAATTSSVELHAELPQQSFPTSGNLEMETPLPGYGAAEGAEGEAVDELPYATIAHHHHHLDLEPHLDLGQKKTKDTSWSHEKPQFPHKDHHEGRGLTASSGDRDIVVHHQAPASVPETPLPEYTLHAHHDAIAFGSTPPPLPPHQPADDVAGVEEEAILIAESVQRVEAEAPFQGHDQVDIQGQDDEGEGHGDSPDGGPTLTPHQDHPKLQANSYRGKGPPTELDDGDDERLFAMQWACRHDDSKYLRRQLYPGPLNIFRSENKRVIKRNWSREKDTHGRGLLHVACEHNSAKCALLLLKKYRTNILYPDQFGRTPLHTAAAYKANVIVSAILLYKGVNFEQGDMDGATALHLACQYNDPKIAKLLLERWADRNCADHAGRQPLHYAAYSDSVKAIRHLVGKGFVVNSVDNEGATPLHHACYGEAEQAARLLVESRASINARDVKQRTPLHEASARGSAGIVSLLLEAGAGADVRDAQGNTPLHDAAAEGSASAVRLLLKAEPSMVDVENHEGKRPADLTQDDIILKMIQTSSADKRGNASGAWESDDPLLDAGLTSGVDADENTNRLSFIQLLKEENRKRQQALEDAEKASDDEEDLTAGTVLETQQQLPTAQNGGNRLRADADSEDGFGSQGGRSSKNGKGWRKWFNDWLDEDAKKERDEEFRRTVELERQLMFSHTSEEQLPPPTPQQPSPPASSSLNYSQLQLPPRLSTYYRLRPTVEAVPQAEPIFINEDDKDLATIPRVTVRKRQGKPDEAWRRSWLDEINRYYKFLHDTLDFGDNPGVLNELVKAKLFGDAERDEVLGGVNLYAQNTIFLRLLSDMRKPEAKQLVGIFAKERDETATTLTQMYKRASRGQK